MKTIKIIGIIVISALIAIMTVSCKKRETSQPQIPHSVTQAQEEQTDETVQNETLTVNQRDITTLIRQEANFLGMFGDNYQKMGIAFLNITRTNDTQYEVTGKSKLEDNVSNFRGMLEVQSLNEMIFPLGDHEIIGGEITGKYQFEEDRSQPATGIFEGTFEIIYTNEDYIGLHNISPGNFHTGASFEGTWISYRTGVTFIASWGNLLSDFNPIAMPSAGELWISEEFRSSGWGFELDQQQNLRDGVYSAEKIMEHPDYLKWFEWWK